MRQAATKSGAVSPRVMIPDVPEPNIAAREVEHALLPHAGGRKPTGLFAPPLRWCARVERFDPRDPETWLSRELFAAYCGARAEKLLAYYDKAKAKRSLIVFSFDWLAILLLPAWLGYRRQWILWGTLVGLIAVVTVVTELAHIDLPAGAFTGGLLALGA